MLRPRLPAASALAAQAAAAKAAAAAPQANRPQAGGAKMVSANASPWAAGGSGTYTSGLAQKEMDMKRRQDELKSRREKEEGKRLQHAAAFAVRKVIHRLRVVEPAQFPELVAELEAVQTENLDAMGELVEAVREEAEKALGIAEGRFKQFEEKKIAKEKADQDKAKKTKEDAERIGNIAIEAAQEVEEVEAKVAAAVEQSSALSDLVKEAEPAAILEAVKTNEEAMAAAKEVYKTAVASLKEKRDEVAKARGVKEASTATAALIELQKRLTESQKALTPLIEVIKATKEKAARKTAALKKEQDQKEAFSKHDRDRDGKLNKKEVMAFAKTQYTYDLDAKVVDKILGKIPGGKTGVTPATFLQLRYLVSMEKATMKARLDRAEAEEKERVRKEEEERMQTERDAKKAAIKDAFEQLDAKLSGATELVVKAREAAKKIVPELSANLMTEAAEATELEVKAARTVLEACEEMLKPLEGEEGEDTAVKTFRTAELGKRTHNLKSLKAQVSSAGVKAKEAKDSCARKQYAEMESFRTQVVPCVLAVLQAESKTGPELFKASTKSKNGIGGKDFTTLLKSLSTRAPADCVPEGLLESSFDESQAKGFFAHLASGKDAIGEEEFTLAMTIRHYRVAKSTVLSAEKAMTSKALRKLEIGELLTVFEGPTVEGDVKRMRCKSVQDDQEGWVTLEGNKGSVFLEPVSSYFTCVKETNLAEGVAVGAKSLRKIFKGENAQMLEPEKKDDACGVFRMKVRMVRDDQIGWVTTTGNKTAVKFFEPC